MSAKDCNDCDQASFVCILCQLRCCYKHTIHQETPPRMGDTMILSTCVCTKHIEKPETIKCVNCEGDVKSFICHSLYRGGYVCRVCVDIHPDKARQIDLSTYRLLDKRNVPVVISSWQELPWKLVENIDIIVADYESKLRDNSAMDICVTLDMQENRYCIVTSKI